MKKSTLGLTLLATLGLSNVATAQTGWFVKGDLGYGKLSLKAPGVTFKKNNFSQAIGAGYDYGDFRLSLDYTHNQKLKSEDNRFGSSVKADLTVHQIGFNAVYRFANESAVEPYLGARISANFVNSNTYIREPGLTLETETSDLRTGYGALAGVEFKLADHLNADVGVQYDYLGKIDNVKVQNIGVKTGLRYTF
ncbi:opacity family porin [Muribacter muris]|uniref:opacity family porin n=1 Tax=Muribacter muris TaxID=67855 RepID=UPI00069EF0ED|nr:opacity family porin [Muribacter muris]